MTTLVQDEQKSTPDSLPTLESPYPLTDEQVAAYQRSGFALLRSIASSDEVATYRTLITGMTDEFAKSYKPLAQRDTYGKAFIQLINLWQRDAAIAKFTQARRFARIAAELMGVDGVRLTTIRRSTKRRAGDTPLGTRISNTGPWTAFRA